MVPRNQSRLIYERNVQSHPGLLTELRATTHAEEWPLRSPLVPQHEKGTSGDRSPPYTVRTDDALKVRFSATVGEEPEIELALTLRFRVQGTGAELRAKDVLSSRPTPAGPTTIPPPLRGGLRRSLGVHGGR